MVGCINYQSQCKDFLVKSHFQSQSSRLSGRSSQSRRELLRGKRSVWSSMKTLKRCVLASGVKSKRQSLMPKRELMISKEQKIHFKQKLKKKQKESKTTQKDSWKTFNTKKKANSENKETNKKNSVKRRAENDILTDNNFSFVLEHFHLTQLLKLVCLLFIK